jgi:hypothetical protein
VFETASAWSAHIGAWSRQTVKAPTLQYENFLASSTSSLAAAFELLGTDVNPTDVATIIQAHTKKRVASLDKTFAHNTFVRRGVAGD